MLLKSMLRAKMRSCVLLCLPLGLAVSEDKTLFLHHFDSPMLVPPDVPLQYPVAADYAVGSTAIVTDGGRISNEHPKWGAGSLDHANYGGTLRYNTAENFNLTEGTVEMWIYPTDWQNEEFNGFFGLTASNFQDIRFQKRSDKKIEAYMLDVRPGVNTNWYVETDTDVALTDNQWHHLAWTWDFANQSSALYLDGQVVSINLVGPLVYGGTVKSSFEIGTIQNGSASFDGFIDDFRISNFDRYLGEPFAVPTGPFTVPLTCDFNTSGTCTVADLDLLIMAASVHATNPQFDLNGSGGPIDLADRDAWLAAAGSANLVSRNPYKLGDINLDGVVDGSDFGIWNSNKFTATGKWSKGDLNADGTTDGSDFGLWNSNKFTSSDSITIVPEPASLTFLVAMFLGLAVVRCGRDWRSIARY